MGTSFVEYKGFGFWTRDNFLESWLTALINELDKLPILETWQKELVEHWRVQATIDGGCMAVDLDEFLIDHTRESFLLSLAENVLDHCDSLAYRTGQLFIALLAGKLKTTASSPIDYLD
jgi:hypothetical protein